MKLAMGIYDSPQTQEQPIFYLDHYKNNIAVFGGPMTGKTTFVKTLLVRLHDDAVERPEEDIYIIDFGGNLGEYGKLHHVCAYFDNSNEENIKRVFKTLESRLEENSKELGSYSYYVLAESSPKKCPNHMTLIIENLNALLSDERYSNYQERLLKLCRDGLSKGLSIVVTANELTGASRIIANCGQKVAFEMPSDSYYEIFNAKIHKPMKIPGRGIVNIGSGTYEFQCFLPFEEEEKGVQKLLDHYGFIPKEHALAAFPDVLTLENIMEYRKRDCPLDQNPDSIVVGLDYYDHQFVNVNIAESRSIAIYGKRRFGKSNLLSLLLDAIKQRDPNKRFVYLDDGRKQLEGLFEADQREKKIDAHYFTDVASLRDFLTENGYGGIRRKTSLSPRASEVSETTPFTVFVLQGKMLYQSSPDAKYLLAQWFPEMIGNAEARQYLFIFSDVRNISEPDIRITFNNTISVAFLLDNIGDFVADKGNKSVFGEMDAKELKSEYARCAVGDGYFYDIETDTLKKLKFIKHDEND